MKKQLLNELENEAPFRQSLKDDIIKEVTRTSKKQIPWIIWTVAGTFTVALAAFLLINLYNPKSIQYDSAMKVEQKAKANIEAIVSIEGAKLNDRFVQLSSEEQLFLTSIYNSDAWEPIGEDEIPSEQLELNVTTMEAYKEPQPLVILYNIEQAYTTLHSMKGKLTLKGTQMDQFNGIIKNAFRFKGVEKSMNVDAFLYYQPQFGTPQYDPDKVGKLKEILKEVIYSTGTIIETKEYPDGYIKITSADQSYRLNYWVKQNKVIIDGGVGVGELTGEARHKFIQFIIEEGIYRKGVRVVTSYYESMHAFREKLDSLPNSSYNETEQTPNYILNLNGNAYFLTILENKNQLIVDFTTAYALSDFEDEMNTLREISNSELNNFMQERTWEKGKLEMVGPPDFEIRWNGQMYQVWVNGGTMIGRVNDESVWEDLTEKEVEMLEQLSRELK